jgi:hypothetical protein
MRRRRSTSVKRACLLVMLAACALCAALAWSSAACATEGCMSPAVGEAISRQLAAHAFDGVLPPGWELREVAVQPDRIALVLVDDRAHEVKVQMRLLRDAQGLPDGKGRFFAFYVEPGATRLDARSRDAIVTLATRIDGVVPEDEALHGCQVASSAPRWLELGGPLPRWLSRVRAVLEVLLVLGGLAFVARRWRSRPRGETPGRLGALAIFVGALFATHASAGWHALLWIDTVNDQRDVTRCLAGPACTSVGEATSVAGLFHAVAWLDFRTLVTSVGLPLDAVLWMAQLASALAATFAAWLACRAGGRLGALLAAIVAVLALPVMVKQSAVYNTLPLPFLGALVLAVAVEAIARPTTVATALLALLTALLANVHSACALAGISVVWVALLPPAGRWRRAALSGFIFVAATFAMAPGSWMANTHYVWTRLVGSHASGAHALEVRPLAGAADYFVLVMAGAVLAFVLRHRLGPRAAVLHAAVALALPMLGAMLVAQIASSVPTQPKYLAHIVAPLAVMLAGPAGAVLQRVAPRRVLAAATFAPYAAAPLVAWLGQGHTTDVRELTFHDLMPLPAELQKRGWTYGHVYRSLKSPDDAIILSSLDVLAPSFPAGPAGDDPTNVYVLKVPDAALPASMPADWHVLSTSPGASTLMIFARTALDWSRFEACDVAAASGPTCQPSGLTHDGHEPCAYCVDGLPAHRSSGTVELRLPFRPALTDRAWAVSMPRSWRVCGGKVDAVEGVPLARVSDGGRRATWTRPDGESRGELRLVWEQGSERCPAGTYTGFPPFFLEGDESTVRQLEALGL